MNLPKPRLRPWPARRTARLALAGVAVGAGVISYTHAWIVVSAHQVLPVVAWTEPLLADLCIIGGTANLIDASRKGWDRKRDFPWLTLTGILVAASVTIWMNVAAAQPASVPVWCVNGWPPVAFGLALESLLSLLRRSSKAGGDDPEEPASTKDALAVLLTTGSRRAIAAELRVDKNRVDSWAAMIRQGQPAALNGDGPHE